MAPISSASPRPSPVLPPTHPSLPAARAPSAPAATARATGHSTADVFERPLGEAAASRPAGPVTDRTRITPGGRETWRGADILRNLDQRGSTDCAASAELANAIVSGPGSTDRYVLGLVRANEGRPEVRAELADIYQRLGRGTSTYGDMHRLQEITHDTYETDHRPGMSPSEIATMRGGLSRGITRDDPASATEDRRVLANGTGETPARTRERVDALRPGESFMMSVDAGGPDRHAVTVGRDRDGRTYLYDSAPRAGDPTFSYEAERPEVFSRYTDGTLGSGTMNLIVGGATQRDW